MQVAKQNSKLLMESYKQIGNNLNNVNRQPKRNYFSKKITQFQADLKKTWKTFKQVINKTSNTTAVPYPTVDGQTVNSDKEIASSINEHFCNIRIELNENISKVTNPPFLVNARSKFLR